MKAHRDDRIYLEGPYQGQVNVQIQAAYAERECEIFDIMAITVIRQNLHGAAVSATACDIPRIIFRR